MPSVKRRARIVAVAVLVADGSIAAVGDDFGVFTPRDAAGGVLGRALRAMLARDARVAHAANRPAAIMRHDVLVLADGEDPFSGGN